MSLPSAPFEAIGLLFLLGLRHGLDPDHIAVIDNITFRALDERPAAAPWTGLLFSAGHSLSVLAVALLFGVLGHMVRLPQVFGSAMSVAVIGLLLLVGTLNLRALRAPSGYRPHGWRHAFVPAWLRRSTHPVVTLLTGALFGLVVDTAAQIAAWGATAAAAGGLYAAACVGLCFAAGMIATDTADSWIVAGLLKHRQAPQQVAIYRRRIGWMIVGLSYGMAAVSLVNLVRSEDFSDEQAVLIGATVAALVVAAAVAGPLARRLRARRGSD